MGHGIGSIAEKRRVLEWLRNSDRKYRKPLETGELNLANFLGGSWNEYAEVVFSMLMLDTMVNIEEQLRTLNRQVSAGRDVQAREGFDAARAAVIAEMNAAVEDAAGNTDA